MEQQEQQKALSSLKADLKRVESQLFCEVSSDLDFLTEVGSHMVSAGGKRIRPGFCIISACVNMGEPVPVSDEVIKGAVAVELVHLGSLYHDDVMDKAHTRRNVTSVNALWDDTTAILGGDFLLAKASVLAADLGVSVSALLAKTIASLCEGQIREQQDLYNLGRTPENYMKSIEGKTASLLSASCCVGALVAGLKEAEKDALEKFGRSYGLAFQIADDIADILESSDSLGKPSGNDLLEGNYTLPVICALESEEGAELRDILGPDEKSISKESVSKIRDILAGGEGIARALEFAREYVEEASQMLKELPDKYGRQNLEEANSVLLGRVEELKNI